MNVDIACTGVSLRSEKIWEVFPDFDYTAPLEEQWEYIGRKTGLGPFRRESHPFCYALTLSDIVREYNGSWNRRWKEIASSVADRSPESDYEYSTWTQREPAYPGNSWVFDLCTRWYSGLDLLRGRADAEQERIAQFLNVNVEDLENIEWTVESMRSTEFQVNFVSFFRLRSEKQDVREALEKGALGKSFGIGHAAMLAEASRGKV